MTLPMCNNPSHYNEQLANVQMKNKLNRYQFKGTDVPCELVIAKVLI